MLVSRRTFFFGGLTLPAFAGKKPEAARPGILLLLVDQLPAFMLGAYGNKVVRTQNLDRLAAMGTIFNNHFACAPSPVAGRNTLLTGRTPIQLGEAGALSSADVPLSKILGDAGYACQEGDLTAAGKFLDSQSAGKPFFFTANCPSLRPPYGEVAQKFTSLYAIEPFLGYAPELPAPNAAAGKEMLTNILGNVRKVAAQLSALDEAVGAVLAKLHAKGLHNDTIVVFTSSCGALWGRHGLWDAAAASDPPNMYEAAVRTPIFLSWPGHLAPGTHRPDLVSAYDLVPTLCDLLSIPVPQRNLVGHSYAIYATTQTVPKKWKWPKAVYAWQGNTGMAREDRYKLVERNDGKGPNELYDLVADPEEANNQAANPQFSTIHNDLTAELAAWKAK